jgi:hypothetical protein
MRFYKVMAFDTWHNAEYVEWRTSLREAKKTVADWEGCSDPGRYCCRFELFDIPTKKAELLNWLEVHGMGLG